MSGSHQPIVVHDYFAIRGGGERVALTLARGLDTVLMYGFRGPETFEPALFPEVSIDLKVSPIWQRRMWRVPALALRFARAKEVAARHETRIFSGVSAPFAAPSTGRNIYYCHTPPRFLYDLRDYFAVPVRGPYGLIRQAALARYQRGYEAAVARMQTIVSNSETVRSRIREHLGRESTVVYPPCDTESFTWGGQGGYYLSTARLSPLKRVDRIVEAFLDMPDKQLVVASGGEELDGLRRLARGAENISFLGWVGEAELRRLIGEAIASIYIPVAEDFGMSPVESMAAGKPVIGVAEGGLRETIVDGETGTLLAPGFGNADLVAAVRAMTPQRAATMRSACEARAELFSEQRFIAKMRALVHA